MKKNHPFHMVPKSPWPIIASFSLLMMTMGATSWMHEKKSDLLIQGILLTSMTSILWWRDVIRESTMQGMHTKSVSMMMKGGMILFIVSEIMFFTSFFWSFFHSSLSPSVEIGMNWPPKGIKVFNPIEVPLLNTMILISSGATITWAHHSLISNKMKETIKATYLTVLLGLIFTLLQGWEYSSSTFSMADSVYGSLFFMSTGFHGLHVIMGTLFISSCLERTKKMHLTKMHHSGMEMASWYWHFVDVVWLILYISVYWWSN
nr:cytochrome c oxidase subunit III [Borysthenes sp. 1 WQW-2023a]